MAILGDCAATTEPAVEQTGQRCEVDGPAVKSVKKWNWAARKTTPRINAKMRMLLDLDCMCLLRRSLGNNDCGVKNIYFCACLFGTNHACRTSKMLR